jgi:hypothetical protein
VPWCPTCQGEYLDSVAKCPTCDVALVAILAEPPDEIDDGALLDSDEELATLARGEFSRVLEMRASLKGAQIPCALIREAQDPEVPREARHGAIVELLVPVTRLDDAVRVLQGQWRDLLDNEGLAPVAPSGGGGEGMHCPACGFAFEQEVEECPDCGLAFGPAA